MSHDLSRSSSVQRSDSPDIYGAPEPVRPDQLRGAGVTGAPASNTASNGGTQSSTNPAPTVRAPLAIVAELDHIVDQYWGQHVSKSCAIGLIASKPNFAASRNEPDKDRAFEQYLSSLESIEHHTVEANRRGSFTAQHLDHESDPGRVSSQSPQPNQYASEAEVRAFIRSRRGPQLPTPCFSSQREYWTHEIN